MSSDILVHHGIKGQRWGIRRYQNKDGSYTSAGKRRYGVKVDGPGSSLKMPGGIRTDGVGSSSAKLPGGVRSSRSTNGVKVDGPGSSLKMPGGIRTDGVGSSSAKLPGGVRSSRSTNGVKEVSTDYRRVSKIQNEGSNIANTTSRMARNRESRKKEKIKQGIDVSQMTNKELQDAITRMNLERNYKSLEAERIDAGKRHVSDYLSFAGDVLAVGASAATIAATIYQLKK